MHFLKETIASNPAANRCTRGDITLCGPGMIYQNLYVPNDGNPIVLDD